MSTALGRFRPIIIALSVVLALMAGWLIMNIAARAMVGTRIERMAASRGLDASWRSLRVRFPTAIAIDGLVFSPPSGAPLFQADSLDIEVTLGSVLTFQPRPKRVRLTHARVRLGVRGGGDPDTLAPAEPDSAPRREPIDRIRDRVRTVFGWLLAPVRDIEHISVRDVIVASGEDARMRGLVVERFDQVQHAHGIELSGAGVLRLARDVRWELGLDYGHDDRIAGVARFDVPASAGVAAEVLEVTLDGRLTQDREAGRLTIADSTVVAIGRVPLVIAGMASRREPRLVFSLAAQDVTRQRIVASVPRVVLGPLNDLVVSGAFDYQAHLDLDFSKPDSVEIEARVTPRALAIDSARTVLDLALAGPFDATVLLPGIDPVERHLSPDNPFYRRLERMDSVLVNAIVTNEDGAFFDHGGFNLGAVKQSIAENLRAGGYRRGAGTITMQLARNLYTGHDRTLSRKAQEVVLAWVLEHLSGLSKQRLLEIYLNLIEWGPGVHGAAEAARYYFDRDVSDLSVDEALFLSTVVPSPRKWLRRFDDQHRLRDWTRAQMHFIGRAMIRKGWLDPALLPPAESLHVELRGAARAAASPPGLALEQAARHLDQARTSWPERLDRGALNSDSDSLGTFKQP